MRVVADTSRCIGSGQCVLTEPAVFDQSEDDGTVIVLVEHPGNAELEKARLAVQNCPSRALSLRET
jgi:ferredoxin